MEHLRCLTIDKVFLTAVGCILGVAMVSPDRGASKYMRHTENGSVAANNG
jgi:hypothetical protein